MAEGYKAYVGELLLREEGRNIIEYIGEGRILLHYMWGGGKEKTLLGMWKERYLWVHETERNITGYMGK